MSEKNIIADLRVLLADLETKPLDVANDLASNRLLQLVDIYRPRISEPTQDDLRREIVGMARVPATVHLRAKTGLGLREAADLYDRLTRSA
jgi:hypothetical protein